MRLREVLSGIMKTVLVVLSLLLVLATAIPILTFDQWWVRIFDFPRVQITIFGILLLLFYLYFWNIHRLSEAVVLGLLVLALGYQLVKIFPYTPLSPKQVLAAESSSDDANLSMLVANVLMENRKSEEFLALVRDYDPDVILTLETDDWWEEALKSLEEDYPHTLKKPLDTGYGMLLHSRLELIDPEVRFILKDGIPSMHMQVVLPSDDRVFMHFVHPKPPNPKYASDTMERDAELLIVGREVEAHGKPAIIAGDFNDVAWSKTTAQFQKASGLLDPRVGRGMYNTFSAKSFFLRWPLDHIFSTDDFKLVHIDVGPAWGSDHFPIFIELSLEPGAKADQDEPKADQAKEDQIDELIEDGRQQPAE